MNIAGLSNELKTEIQALYGVADDAATLQKFTDAVARAVINHIKNNADIDLVASDIKIDAGTFKDSLNVPITGVGISQAVTLEMKIK